MVGINYLFAVDGVFFLIFGSCENFTKIINPEACVGTGVTWQSISPATKIL